jgi:glutathione S-transferase
MIVPIEWRINDVNDETVRSDLGALPGHLDRIDGWIADGLLGGAPPNAADLQIGSSLALLRTKEDVRRAIAGRPCETLAEKWFSDFPGNVPAGTFPADWLPVPAQAA